MFNKHQQLTTTHGKEAFYDKVEAHSGYLYNFSMQENNDYRLFKCKDQRKGCQATTRIRSDNGEVTMRCNQETHATHCVVSEVDYINRQASQQMLSVATELGELSDARRIYETMFLSLRSAELTSEHYVGMEGYKLLQDYESCRKSINRRVKQDGVRLQNPKDLESLLTQLNDPKNEAALEITVNTGSKSNGPEKFIFGRDVFAADNNNNHDNVCICFGTEAMIRELYAQEMILVDGTFKVVPKILSE